jgi:tetratricopeptide (TPR) repeat protein
LFYTAALLLYAYWPERQIGFVLALIVLVLFGLGFASKETVISLPISLFLYDFIFISKCEFRSLLERWRFHSVFIALGVAAATYLLQQWRQYLQPDPTLLSPWQYFLTQTRVIVHYVQLLVVPVGLNLDYDFRASKSVLDPSVLICAAILIALLTAAFYWRRSRPIIAFAIFWFFITLAPTSSLIPIQDVIFEHRLYLPLVAVCLILPVLVRQKAVTCGVLALCLVGTIYRNYTWGDEVRLYSDIVQKSPAKARAYNALTVAYVKRGDVEDAIATAQNGIANVAGSGKYELYTILGNLYLQSGRYNDAIDAYDVAVAGEDPAAVYNNLGIAYLRLAQQLRSTPGSMSADDLLTTSKKLLSQAENAFLESYHRDSSNFASLDTYVDVRHQEDDVGVWRSELAGELQQKPTFESYYSLGKLSWLDHNYKEAVEYFENALRTGRDDKLLRYNYAFALAQTDQVPLAIDQYLNAIRKDPAFWEAHFNVALLYLSRDDTQNAVAHLEEVLRLKPGHPPTLLHLARLFIQQNQPARARPYLQEVLRINPQDPEALSLFKRLGS